MSKNDTGVFQLDNGYWGYRYAIRIDGKSRENLLRVEEIFYPYSETLPDSLSLFVSFRCFWGVLQNTYVFK